MSRPTRGGEDASRRVSVKVSVLLLHPHLLLWASLGARKTLSLVPPSRSRPEAASRAQSGPARSFCRGHRPGAENVRGGSPSAPNRRRVRRNSCLLRQRSSSAGTWKSWRQQPIPRSRDGQPGLRRVGRSRQGSIGYSRVRADRSSARRGHRPVGRASRGLGSGSERRGAFSFQRALRRQGAGGLTQSTWQTACPIEIRKKCREFGLTVRNRDLEDLR